MFFTADAVVHAEENSELNVHMDAKVIYCAATLKESDSELFHTLKDGIPVTTIWHIQVNRVREYWMNKAIAEISLARRVVPDLLSRSWLLEDQASGISRKVYTLDEVVRFLSNLEHLPVLDRSLLAANNPYVMSVEVEMHAGEVNDAWWGKILRTAQFSMEKEFLLP